MAFKLSNKSLAKLEGVDPDLVKVTKLAITHSTIDFAVIEGLRTVERQRELVAKGASQTMQSNHLTGQAVDLAAYIGDRISWEVSLYDDIADAVKLAAIECDVPIRWGGAWQINDIRNWDGTMQDAMDAYIRQRKVLGKRPFIDAPHFEIGKVKAF